MPSRTIQSNDYIATSNVDPVNGDRPIVVSHSNMKNADYDINVAPTPTIAEIPQQAAPVTPKAVYPRSKYIYIGTRKPVELTCCPNCSQVHVTTRTYTKTTGTTWLCAGVGLLVFWPLCWVPFVCKPMKQTNHYCRQCGAKVGRVKPFQS